MMTLHVEIVSEKLEITRYQFWQAVWIWTLKPHVVNKHLFGVETVRVYRSLRNESVDEIIDKLNHLHEQQASFHSEECVSEHISSLMPLKPCLESDTRIFSEGCYFFVRHLLLKRTTPSNPIELCFIDYTNDVALFYYCGRDSENEHDAIVSFMLHFDDCRMKIRILQRSVRVKYEWMKFRLLPKLINWAKESESVGTYTEESKGSLNLIPLDRYKELYSLWKEKYGKGLIENWTESTDPSKFVHEDIAIATYLSLLWGNNRTNFVDLGCGNGLLVYILTQEGHRGRGIDIRSRKIWSMYPPSTILESATITSEDNGVHPDADWLIGNHSDELTPWIPVFAARSSSHCKFFLLPCCAYELSGQKFRRRNSSISMYSDYIDYVKNLCEEFGFDITVDRLRIPSTKRICLIGHRKLLHTDAAQIEENVKTVLSKYQDKNFVPREAVEPVRNCTRIDKVILNRIRDTISQKLIELQLSEVQSVDMWSTRCSLSFEDAIRLLNPEDLKKLKNECGGLQTLLRNNRFIFKIENSRISFRKPGEKKNCVDKWKLKPCWFFHNHPMKCPLPESKCSFSH